MHAEISSASSCAYGEVARLNFTKRSAWEFGVRGQIADGAEAEAGAGRHTGIASPRIQIKSVDSQQELRCLLAARLAKRGKVDACPRKTHQSED
jgi:hypothetical protein